MGLYTLQVFGSLFTLITIYVISQPQKSTCWSCANLFFKLSIFPLHLSHAQTMFICAQTMYLYVHRQYSILVLWVIIVVVLYFLCYNCEYCELCTWSEMIYIVVAYLVLHCQSADFLICIVQLIRKADHLINFPNLDSFPWSSDPSPDLLIHSHSHLIYSSITWSIPMTDFHQLITLVIICWSFGYFPHWLINSHDHMITSSIPRYA